MGWSPVVKVTGTAMPLLVDGGRVIFIGAVKSPCQYFVIFPFVVAPLLLEGRLAALAPVVIHSTVVIHFLTRTQFSQSCILAWLSEKPKVSKYEKKVSFLERGSRFNSFKLYILVGDKSS